MQNLDWTAGMRSSWLAIVFRTTVIDNIYISKTF